jgi:hypothetical protein
LNITGPFESSLIKIAINKKIGNKTISAINETKESKILFITPVKYFRCLFCLPKKGAFFFFMERYIGKEFKHFAGSSLELFKTKMPKER